MDGCTTTPTTLLNSMGNSIMGNDEAWAVLDALRAGEKVTNGQVLDAVDKLGLCVPPVQPSESERFTTLVSLLNDLVCALVGQTAAINRILEADDMSEEPMGLNPRR